MSAIPSVAPRSLPEPDKRISHTSGSSVDHSESLRPTTRIQVFADMRFGPPYPLQRLKVTLPCVCVLLAFTVQPFQQVPSHMAYVGVTCFRIIRYGVVIQMSDGPYLRPSQHLSFLEYVPAPTRPIRELVDSQTQPLTIGAPFHLKVSLLGLPTVVCKSQKGELLRLPAPSSGVLAGEATKLDASRLFLGQL